MRLLCECNSFHCNKTVELSMEDALRHVNQDGTILLHEDCQFMPKGEILRRGENYLIMKEVKNEQHTD